MTAVTWKLTICILITSALFVFAPEVSAQVVINEFSSFSSDDWIELYNTSGNQVNLKNWSLKDSSKTNNVIYEFKEPTMLPVDGYCVLDVKKRLNKDKDKLTLLNGSVEKDCVVYGSGNKEFCGAKDKANVDAPADNQTAARQPNGIGDFTLTSPTREFSNDESLKPANEVVCTTPTPEPTSTPKPTASPTPRPSPTPAPTISAVPTESSIPIAQKATVAAAITSRPSPTPSPDVLGENSQNAESKTPVYAYVFMGLGVGLIGMAAAPFVVKAYNRHKSVSFQQNETPEQNNPLL